jgi:transposase InsO family protein
MMAEKANFTVSWLCRKLEVARSGFYQWLKQPLSPRSQQDQQLAGQVQTLFEQSQNSYGSPRIHERLQQQGWSISRKRVIRLMQHLGLVARPHLRHPNRKTTGGEAIVAENLLQRQFFREHPDQAWVGDITYLPTTEGWRYLAVWIDLFSRRVVGWSLSDHLRTELVVEALHRALGQRQPHPEGLLVHSDQGCQYTSHAYQQALQTAGLTCSMSRRGNCWDNAVAESFFSTLKNELLRPLGVCSPDQLHTQVAFWIDGFYNQQRIHSTLGYLSPVEFERRYNQTPIAMPAPS